MFLSLSLSICLRHRRCRRIRGIGCEGIGVINFLSGEDEKKSLARYRLNENIYIIIIVYHDSVVRPTVREIDARTHARASHIYNPWRVKSKTHLHLNVSGGAVNKTRRG